MLVHIMAHILMLEDMIFSSLLFIFVFLPGILFLYYVLGRVNAGALRNIILLLASCFKETRLVHSLRFDIEQVYEEEPDIFILEMVERYAPGQMLTYWDE